MTIAKLVVLLEANAAKFHAEMESVARRVERTGRMIARAGREMSVAISLPLLAAGFAAFHALLEQSARHFGPLSSAFNQLKADVHGLFLSLGHELEPVFLQIIALLRSGIGHLHAWIQAFDRLPHGVKSAVVYVLLFLAALGPTLLIVGKVIAAVGAFMKVLGLLISPMGLVVVAVVALAAAALYVVTHWEWAKLQLLSAWTFIVALFFDSVRLTLIAVDILTLGLTKITGVTDYLRGKLDALADKTLGKLGASLLQAQKDFNDSLHPAKQFAAQLQVVTDIVDKYNEGMRQAIVRQHLFGAEFNQNAAQAKLLEEEINALIAAGPKAVAEFEKQHGSLGNLVYMYNRAQDGAQRYNEALNVLGTSLEAHGRLLVVAGKLHIDLNNITDAELIRLRAYATELTSATAALQQSVAGGFAALGQRLGQIFAGMAHGFRGFGKVMEGVLGTMLSTLGQVLIAYGVAGIAIRRFITNPYAALAAGVALVALGSALQGAAQATVGDGGGGGAPASAAGPPSSASSSQGSGTIVLEFHGGRADFTDPRDQDILAQALRDLSGRNVAVVYSPS